MATEPTATKPRAPRSDKGSKRPNPAADLARVLTYCRVSVQVLEAMRDDDAERNVIITAKCNAYKSVLKEAGESL